MKKLLSRKLRQGAYNTLLCVLLPALLAACVVMTDYLEDHNGWQLDCSFNAITTQSEATLHMLDALTEDVHIYAVFSQGYEDAQLIALLDRYQARSPHVTWSMENLSQNPLLLQLASDYTDDAAVSTDCVIIRCEATGRTRVLTGEDYIAYGYNTTSGLYEITGWTYEKSLSEAILYVTMEDLPRIQILAGHGELTESETAVLEDYLVSANYEITRVNLLSGDAPDPGFPLMILSPTRDVTQEELQMLLSFAQSGGSLFITVDYTDPASLPNLYSLYRLYGFEPIPGVVIADAADKGSYLESQANLLPYMLSNDLTGVLVTGGADFVILSGARALETPADTDSNLLTYVVLESGETAYIRTLPGDGSAITIEQQEGDRSGAFALALCADRAFDTGIRSRAFIIGNSSLFLDEWMYSYTYSGELLLQTAQYLQGKAPVNLDIIARDAVRPQLSFDSAAAPAVLLTLPPFIVAVLAVAVLRPRKHL